MMARWIDRNAIAAYQVGAVVLRILIVCFALIGLASLFGGFNVF